MQMTRRNFLIGVAASALVGGSYLANMDKEYSLSEDDVGRAADVMFAVYAEKTYPKNAMEKLLTYDAWTLYNQMEKGSDINDALENLYGKNVGAYSKDSTEKEPIKQSLRLTGKGKDPTNGAVARRDLRKQKGLNEQWHTNSSKWQRTVSVDDIEYYKLENVGIAGQLYDRFCNWVK